MTLIAFQAWLGTAYGGSVLPSSTAVYDSLTTYYLDSGDVTTETTFQTGSVLEAQAYESQYIGVDQTLSSFTEVSACIFRLSACDPSTPAILWISMAYCFDDAFLTVELFGTNHDRVQQADFTADHAASMAAGFYVPPVSSPGGPDGLLLSLDVSDYSAGLVNQGYEYLEVKFATTYSSRWGSILRFGASLGSAAAVPEPASGATAILGYLAVGIIWVRRRRLGPGIPANGEIAYQASVAAIP
ncbi:hypothetical protein OJF2_21610 [Aquisphaera giovannonii]|uniref:PEP-CTERM protein-sorting domain-containing protein n=1 Tax=Aquisphaera giovannonii TaxID=406548 RepID=A0A5B9VZ25_9BACT|nr:hypothetical protein [Aquisphaera giovannonii]QEH33656.1 hypothetical protein OJF2_21610 [Aquisphaera giovannonii]